MLQTHPWLSDQFTVYGFYSLRRSNSYWAMDRLNYWADCHWRVVVVWHIAAEWLKGKLKANSFSGIGGWGKKHGVNIVDVNMVQKITSKPSERQIDLCFDLRDQCRESQYSSCCVVNSRCWWLHRNWCSDQQRQIYIYNRNYMFGIQPSNRPAATGQQTKSPY